MAAAPSLDPRFRGVTNDERAYLIELGYGIAAKTTSRPASLAQLP